MLPAERLGMPRSLSRPRLLEAGLMSLVQWNDGFGDALAGLPWRPKPAGLAGDDHFTSYMLGFRAGELARRGGAETATGSPAGGEEKS